VIWLAKSMHRVRSFRIFSLRWRALGCLLPGLTRVGRIAASAAIGIGLCAIGAEVFLSAETPARSGDTGGNADTGRRLYDKYGCYECHGYEGQGGGSAGPRIGPDPIPLSALITYVREPSREMPPYSDKVVSDKDLTDIYEFLKSLPHPPAASSNPLLR
jgi:mono/diheme cytochrome c family protein